MLSPWVQAPLLTPLLGSDTSVRSRRVGAGTAQTQGALGRELGSALAGGAPEPLTMLKNALRTKMLGHEVRGVFNARDLHDI